jgi:type I restriction enzyme R subunit
LGRFSRNCDEPTPESEWKTRKRRIDPRLDASGWKLRPRNEIPFKQPHRTEEEETSAGPADYALWLDHKIVGLVEAKKLTLGPKTSLPRPNGMREAYGKSGATSMAAVSGSGSSMD